jgi:hypothetical protein
MSTHVDTGLENDEARVLFLAVRDVSAHVESIMITRTLEVGHIFPRDLCFVDNFGHQVRKLGVEGEEKRLDNALGKAVDQGEKKERDSDPI